MVTWIFEIYVRVDFMNTKFRDNSGVRHVRHVRHGASFFFKIVHRNFCDAPLWRILLCYGASSKSWCANNLLEIAEIAIAKDDLVKFFWPCGEKLIFSSIPMDDMGKKCQTMNTFQKKL